MFEPFSHVPTAMQDPAAGHETASRRLLSTPLGAGTDSIVQVWAVAAAGSASADTATASDDHLTKRDTPASALRNLERWRLRARRSRRQPSPAENRPLDRRRVELCEPAHHTRREPRHRSHQLRLGGDDRQRAVGADRLDDFGGDPGRGRSCAADSSRSRTSPAVADPPPHAPTHRVVRVMLVAMNPGHTAVSPIPHGSNSARRHSLSISTAALVVE